MLSSKDVLLTILLQNVLNMTLMSLKKGFCKWEPYHPHPSSLDFSSFFYVLKTLFSNPSSEFDMFITMFLEIENSVQGIMISG